MNLMRAGDISPGTLRERPFIELSQVVKTFKNAAGEFTVLKGIDASFWQGEFVSVVGRSGSGKSTLLNMMTGIDHPTTGTVRIGDIILNTLSEGKMSVWRGRSMGIVFQFFQLLPMLTLLENVMLPMDFGETYPAAEREERARTLLAEVDLRGLEHKYPAAVSGGQQQSAAVARALANDPPILVADEPTGNLDTRTAELILEIFEKQVERGKTVIMVTHDNTLAQRAARKMVISDGELVNEWIAKSLPDLSHDLLLALHHAAEVVSLNRGEALPEVKGHNALVIVTSGQVEVMKNGRQGPVTVERLSPGKLWAAPFLFENQDTQRSVLNALRGREASQPVLCASSEPSTVLVFHETQVMSLFDKSPELKETLENSMLQRATPPRGK